MEMTLAEERMGFRLSPLLSRPVGVFFDFLSNESCQWPYKACVFHCESIGYMHQAGWFCPFVCTLIGDVFQCSFSFKKVSTLCTNHKYASYNPSLANSRQSGMHLEVLFLRLLRWASVFLARKRAPLPPAQFIWVLRGVVDGLRTFEVSIMQVSFHAHG